MIPFSDLKFGIPYGLHMGLPLVSTCIFAIAGSIVPAVIWLAIADPLTKFLRKHSKLMDSFFTWLFDKTRKNHSKNFLRYGALFIILFIAVPIPGSGSISGASIAYVFGVDFWKSVALISLGVMIAGILVATGFESITGLLHIFF